MASYIRDSCEREKIIYAKRNKFVWKVMSLFGSQLMGAQLFRRVWLRVLVPDKLHNAIIIFLRFSNAPVLSKHSDDYELSRDELSDKELSDGKMTPGYRSAPETRFLAYCFLVYFCSAREKGQRAPPPPLFMYCPQQNAHQPPLRRQRASSSCRPPPPIAVSLRDGLLGGVRPMEFVGEAYTAIISEIDEDLTTC